MPKKLRLYPSVAITKYPLKTVYTSLKILLLEDSQADAEILQHFLRTQKPHSIFKVVMNEGDFIDALKTFEPDVVLSDNTLPRYSATDALKTFKEYNIPIPFILVTGTVSEEFAAGIIKAGADDYILKDRLVRLPAAIDSALEKKRIEAEKQKAEATIHFNANLLSKVGQAIIATDINGTVLYWNKAAETLYGWTAEEAMNKSIIELTPSYQTKEDAIQIMQWLSEGKSWSGEFLVKKKDGKSFPALVTNSPFFDKDGTVAGVIGVSIDLTERKQAEQSLLTMQKKITDQQILEQKKISRAIIKAQEEEKNRIGQELHDNINQILAGAKMYLKVATKKNKELGDILAYPIELLDNSIEEIRRLTYNQVTPLDNILLEHQVRNLIENLQYSAAVNINFSCNLQEAHLADDLKLNIYRIIQEQLNNILKHANAGEVLISLVEKNENIELVVMDNGEGFNTSEERQGIGISNMLNRVKSYDGTLEIKSSPGKGCTLKAIIPFV